MKKTLALVGLLAIAGLGVGVLTGCHKDEPVDPDPGTPSDPDEPDEPDEPEIKEIEVFDTVLEDTDKYFYRLGNENEITLSYLFKQADSFEGVIDSNYVEIDFESYDPEGDVKLASLNQDMEEWTNTTFKLYGTGLIQVTLTYTLTPASSEYVFMPFEIYFEVENGCNVTDIDQLGSRTSGSDILLCDIYTTTFKTVSFSGDSGLYGNGFEVYCDATSPYDSGFIELSDTATMDHIRVICKDHSDVYGSSSGNDYNSAVETRSGDITITNSFIQGGRSAIRSRSSSLTLSNTILYGGAYANLLISSTGVITLDNLTTAQYVTCDGTGVMGFGVLIESAADGTSIILKNEIKQYNWVTEEEAEKYFNYSYESYSGSFDGLFQSLKDVEDSLDELNTSILGISCSSITLDDSGITNGVIYTSLESLSDPYIPYLSGFIVDGHKSVAFYHDFDPSEVTITDYGVVKPTFNLNIQSGSDGENTFFYNEDTGALMVTLKDPDTGYSWRPAPTAFKNGHYLEISITMDGEDISNGVRFNTYSEGEHYIIYSYTDPYNYKHDSSGEVTSYSIDYTYTLHVTVVVETDDTQHAVFTFTDTNGNAYPTKVVEINNKQYVTIDNDSGTYSNDSEVVPWTIHDDAAEEDVTLYCPKEYSVENNDLYKLFGDLYWYYPLLTTLTVTDYKNGLKTENEEEIYTYDRSIHSNTDSYNSNDLFSFGGDTRFDVLTPSDNYWSGSYDGSTSTFESHTISLTSYLCIKSNVRSDSSSYSADEWIGEFTYTDNAGQIYYYGIDYYRAAH